MTKYDQFLNRHAGTLVPLSYGLCGVFLTLGFTHAWWFLVLTVTQWAWTREADRR